MAAAVKTRRAKLELVYKGVDIAGNCMSAEYTDHAEGQVDELSCTLEDRDRKWQGAWYPGKGEEVHAYIQCYEWDGPGDAPRLDCGKMEIGEITLSGPPDTVEIRSVSTPVKSTARTQKKTKAWEEYRLSDIAVKVAEKCKLDLFWDGNDHTFDRVDQRGASDLAFLTELCKQWGNSVKTAHDKLIVFKGLDYDQRPPSAILTRGETDIVSYQFISKSHDLYKGAVVTYWHPDKKVHLKGEFFPKPEPVSKDILRIIQPVQTNKDAEVLAQTELRKKNRSEVTANITLKGAPHRRATEVVELRGFGVFDARYLVSQARHSLSGGNVYSTALSLRQVLNY